MASHATSPDTTMMEHQHTNGVVEDGQAEKFADAHQQQYVESKADKKRRRNYRMCIVLGLALPFALQALDLTIIASALPFIANDFHKIGELNWIISAFNLTAATFIPFWAQMADIFGRFYSMMATIVVIAIGSAICTGAPTSTFSVLLLGRALQGIGAAGINTLVRTILADRVSLKEFTTNWTVFMIVAAVSFSVGPVIGGYITKASWRWCFGINLPIVVVALVSVFFLLRKLLVGPQPLPQHEGRNFAKRSHRLLARLATIDYIGQLLFLFGLGLLTLAFTWAGGSYPWTSAHVLAPLILGAILTPSWLVYEYLLAPGNLMARVFPTQSPMIPWELITQRDMGLLFIINFVIGMCMFSIMYFMDLYFALVEHKSSSQSGLALLYYLPGLGLGAWMAMFASARWPRQTVPTLLLGGITSSVGLTILPWAIHQKNTTLIYVMMALVGHGVGIRMNPGTLHALAYFPAMTAPIICLLAFAQPFGGTIALTMMSTILNNKTGPSEDDVKNGIMWAYISMIPFTWLSVVLVAFLGNVWIGKTGHEVVTGPWMWSLVTGKKLKRETRARVDEAVSAPAVEGSAMGDKQVSGETV